MAPTPFENQIVWITGASRGIGAQLAQTFAAPGARLILSAPESERPGLDKTVALCKSLNVKGGTYRIETFDLTCSEEVEQAYARIQSGGWQVDVLVHNAGIIHSSIARPTSPPSTPCTASSRPCAPWQAGPRAVQGHAATASGPGDCGRTRPTPAPTVDRGHGRLAGASATPGPQSGHTHRSTRCNHLITPSSLIAMT